MHRLITVGAALLLVCVVAPAMGAEETAQQRDQRLAWWREARFGLFIHWGPVSIKGTEIGWSRGGERRGTGGKGDIPLDVYDNLYKDFNPTRFDANEWVALAKSAGMKYLVFTTKHHDGFCEFDSKLTDYKITNSPFKRDVVAELAKACHEQGIRLGFYYSPPDWHHPDYRTANHARYIEYLHGQLRELCTNYGQVDIIWFDGLGGGEKDWDARRLTAMIRQLQPKVIINNRAGLAEDYDTPEQTIGGFNNTRPWESCITICQQWAWKPNDRLKSLKQCIRTLARCAGGDGNLLLNVGPMPTGEIEPRQVARLKEMGQWLAKNGASIYGTRGGPYKPAQWGASTHKGNSIYLHIFDGKNVTLAPFSQRKVVSATLLSGGEVHFQQTDSALSLTLPAEGRDENDTVVELKLDGPAADVPLIGPPPSLTKGAKATASNVYQKNNRAHGPQMAVDNNSSTRWATDSGTRQAWLEVDLGSPQTIGRVVIDECVDFGQRINKFELQYLEAGAWKTLIEGTTIGSDYSQQFKPVTAQRVRLNILDASEGPTIWEFHLYAK